MFLKHFFRVVAFLGLVLLLSAGLALWLSRTGVPETDELPDVMYVAAGVGEQARRVDTLIYFLFEHRNWKVLPAYGSYQPAIWLGDDPEKSRWSRKDQANLTAVEWTQRYLSDQLSAIGYSSSSSSPPHVIPRIGHGTDAEMAALTKHIAEMKTVNVVGLVTSPYHMRRLVSRYQVHDNSSVLLRPVPAHWCLSDIMPWTTIPEVLKLMRDSAGLTSSPIFQRWPCGHAWGLLDLIWLGTLLCLVYTWLLYPLCLALITSLIRARQSPAACLPEHIDVLLAAHNEEAVIEARLNNLIDVLGAAGVLTRSRIHVGVDASTDRTCAVVTAVAEKHPEVMMRNFEQRTGKVGILKALARDCRPQEAGHAHFFLLTDANTHFAPEAIPALLRHFGDDSVGGVCGRLVFHDHVNPGMDRNATSSEGAYWTFETWLKTRESRLDSCLGANGAIYMMRQRFFWLDIPDNTIVDDFVLGMKVREQGHTMRYEPAAVAYEELPDEAGEWGRRVRIGAGDYQSMLLCGRCLHLRYGWFAYCFFSHKVMRWLSPHFLINMGASSFLLVIGSVFSWCSGTICILRFAMAMAVLLLLFALWLLSLPSSLTFVQRHHMLRLLRHFALMQWALMSGFLRFCRGDLKGHWNRTART